MLAYDHLITKNCIFHCHKQRQNYCYEQFENIFQLITNTIPKIVENFIRKVCSFPF